MAAPEPAMSLSASLLLSLRCWEGQLNAFMRIILRSEKYHSKLNTCQATHAQ